MAAETQQRYLKQKSTEEKREIELAFRSSTEKVFLHFPEGKFIFKWKFNKYIVRMSHCIIWIIAFLGYSLCTDFKIHAVLNI